jgi:hypothetical protein
MLGQQPRGRGQDGLAQVGRFRFRGLGRSATVLTQAGLPGAGLARDG